MKTFQEKYQAKLEKYQKVFNLEDLNDANDRSNLEIMIKTEIMIDDLQEKIAELMEDDDLMKRASEIKKLHDILNQATNTIAALQRTLNIDRKTRKSEETTSVADYLRALRRNAKDFMDQRRIMVWCPTCKVLVGRIFPVHEHTAYTCSFQCSQCNKMIRARKDEQDVFFDVKDADWRRAHRAEIKQAKKPKRQLDEVIEEETVDDLYLGAVSEVVTDEPAVLPVAVIEDEIELFNGTNETFD